MSYVVADEKDIPTTTSAPLGAQLRCGGRFFRKIMKQRICSIEGCNNPHKAKDLCHSHYYRLKNHGNTHDDVPLGNKGKSFTRQRSEKAEPDNTIFCATCSEYKTSDEFNKSKTRCTACRREQTIIRKYGITQKDFVRMLKNQNGKCKICKTDKPGGRGNTFAIDHCHKTNKIRGLLCVACNRIVMVSVDRVGLKSIAKYLGFKIIKKTKKRRKQ